MTETIVFDFVHRRVYANDENGEPQPISQPLKVATMWAPPSADDTVAHR